MIAFGDASAATFSYSLRDAAGVVYSQRNSCPSGSTIRCDIGFYGYPAESLEVTVLVAVGDGGAVVLTRTVVLKPFNYCGDGITQIFATTSDGGMPQLGDVKYVSACGSI